MLAPFHCSRCGPFRLDEAEVGGSVYCPRCGREVEAEPLVDGSAPTETGATRRSRVFGDRPGAEWEQTVLGEAECRCGRCLSYTFADVGSTLYCDRCGREVRIGEPRAKERQAAEPATVREVPRVTAAFSPPRRRQPPLFTAALAIILLAGVSLLLSYDPSGEAPPRGTSVTSPLSSDGSQPAIGGAVSAAPEANAEGAEEPMTPEAITIEAIRTLLSETDLRHALFEAQYWQHVLESHQTPPSDPRWTELVQVILELLKRLTPVVESVPTRVEEFRDLLTRTRQAIQAQDWSEARKHFDLAQSLFEQHAGELASFSRSLTLLGAQIREREWEQDGAARLMAMLEEARELAEKGDVTSAWERKAVAARLGELAVGLSEADRERIKQNSAGLRDALRLAIGRRAVADAKSCQTAGDGVMRDKCLGEVFDQLPGLPEDKITPLLTEARELQKKSVSRNQTPVGRWFALRRQYERHLEASARGEIEGVAAGCVEVRTGLESDPPVDADWLPDRILATVFALIDPQIQAALLAPAPDVNTIAAIVNAKQTLEAISAWQDEPRWQALATAVKKQAEDWSRQLVRTAESLLAKNQYERAAELLESATGLKDPALLDRLGKIRAELVLRADRKAEAEAWARIELQLDSANLAERGLEVEQFLRRYPDSERREAAERLRTDIISRLKPLAEEQIVQARSAWMDKEHRKFLEFVRALESLPFLESVAPEASELIEQRKQLTRQVDALLAIARRHARLVTDEEIISSRQVLDELLAIDPGHSEAKSLREAADSAATGLAGRYLRKAQLYRTSQNPQMRKTCQKLLQSVLRLDKDSPQAQLARAWLDELP